LLLDRDKVAPTVHEVVESVISGAAEAGLTEKEKSLRRSLRERRETVQELLMEALKAQKLGPTFCSEMVRNMPEFVDHVMIESAALRKTPQYVNAPFSYRVRIYIEQCRVAKTIRYVLFAF
jgi:mTERF domain-containing protein